MDEGVSTAVNTAGRASALVGRPVESGVVPAAADRRWAASVLHDLVVWGLHAGVPDGALRPVEVRLAQVAVELAPDDPTLGALLDWWVAAVVGLRPAKLWYVHPLPDELAAAILPGGWPPNLGSEVKQRRFTDDTARLVHLASTVPVLSQVAKAQAVVRDLNAELKGVVTPLQAGTAPDPGAVAPLAERAEALLRASGVVEGTPLYAKVRRELEARVDLATDLAARVRDLGPAIEPLPAARVKALTRQAGTGDPVLAGRLLAALGGPPPRPEPAGLAVALAEVMAPLAEEHRFFAHRLLGGVAGPVADAAGDKELAAVVEDGRRAEAEVLDSLAGVEPHATGDAADVSDLVRLALDAGELIEARAWLSDLSTSLEGEKIRRETASVIDRAANRGVGGTLVESLAAARAAGDLAAMADLTRQVRLLPGMDRKVSALAQAPAAAPRAGVAAGTVEMLTGGSAVQRGWPERLARPAAAKATPAYVVRVNAHNHFFDGTICTAPAGNRACASSERFKLDFCEKGVRRCAWLAAFAGQPRMELTDPFVDEYRPIIEETPPEAGDVAVLWAATDAGNEVVGLWRVLAVAPARRGWVLNGDRDAAVLLPRGVVPWSAVYRRWSSPRGSQSLRTLDAGGLEGLLVEVRDHLAPLAAEQPGVQRDLAALEVMLADQRARVAEAAAPAGNGAAAEVGKTPVPATPRKAKGTGKTTGAPPAETLHARLRARGGFYPTTLVAQYELAVAESRLVILAGPSGTGKTRLAVEAADELGAAVCLVAVRPDWHANEDLLGYLSPFPGARFSSTPASQFIVAAAGDPGRAYHLCLDEMNLARPEHYLAELLSKMEIPSGRVAFHTGGDEEAGFPAEVAYPANLVVVGTVNLDETTQPVSAKILDRAAYLVVEAGELKAFLDHLPETAAVPSWVPRLLVDLDGSLDDAGQGLGYRAGGRLVRWAVMGAARGHTHEEALDWALSAQVLPRLRFSRSDPAHPEVLEALVGRLRAAPGEFPRSVATLERMLTELRRQDFTLGQMRLS
jgi:hypothetical protein